ncbi:MAG: exodeoxyribonuclease VII large subunit [Nitrospirae bacterium CG18_big_fil_WC_8_21_14_2_50_70_55]|nr:exodeoxyribonuclease VII large subunit [Deltaproteobacteria bacterium]OIP66746.1 MAG: exodeoxyribonuclease VII large subunit [Nitrospirae bacterium CG2_30_70_394]PIQ06387.1 MAG: exodeoxyribonuclease VII large subunit [Nitrospirae bacterium CG18_big_fil_WC_8_21_14_2_50_70_55]PIU77319.1 MAG: exodeoxyribonuclease VII large subunit [Nitrospirae bacterium CG06_land_8_20_14_3_00_70_43]PIW83876.1 MAG: exodeoxyribonuclease VII large subunit [Nitrospirae bacterium CG_4_8_14_3_um_filter_70_85]PIX8278
MIRAPPIAMAPPPTLLTVTEFTRLLQEVVEERFSEVWVGGEVSSLRRVASGHTYFTVKDAGAALACALFRYQQKYQRFELAEGEAVALKGRVSVYPPRGTYQLVVDYFEPLGGGALAAAFDALKRKLEQEGLFDPGRKQPLPLLPRRVGIVTSPTGAVIRDIIQVATARFPNCQLLLAPVRVQGAEAAAEIAAAIARLDRRGDCDVLIVGRGGGSMEDLWPFNEEVVVRAVAAATTPIISAVGHETDFTLCDFAADVRAATPSNAAELAFPVKAELLTLLAQRSRSLDLALRRRLDYLAQRLDTAGRILGQQRRRFRDQREHIARQRFDLAAATVAGIGRRREELGRLATRLERHSPRARLASHQARLAGGASRLVHAGATLTTPHHHALRRLAETLDAVSPLAVFRRGYCIATRPGEAAPLTRSADLAPGDPVELRLAEGRAVLRVEG